MKEQKPILLPLVLVLINFFVKGIFIGSNALAGDEPFSVYHAQLSPSAIVHHLYLGNNPPLYELLLHLWVKTFGISEISVRFPSLIFSCITIWFIYRIGEQFVNKRVGIYASVFFIFSNYHILFTHESRAYALLGMLSAMSMYFYLQRVIKANKELKITIGLLLVNIALMYTHYFGFFVLLLQFFFLIIHVGELRKQWKFLLLNIVVLLLAALPFLTIVLSRFADSGEKATWLTPPSGIDEMFSVLRVIFNSPVGASLAIIALLAGFVILFLTQRAREQRLFNRFVCLWSLGLFVAMFLVSFKIPMFLDRYLMISAIGFMIALALTIDSLFRKNNLKFAVPALFCLLFLGTARPNKTNKREIRELVAEINSAKNGKRTLVLVSPAHLSFNLAYYLNRKAFSIPNETDVFRPSVKGLESKNIWCVNSLSDFDAEKWDRVVIVDAGGQRFVPENNVVTTIEKSFAFKSSKHIEEIFDVSIFEK